MQNSFRYALIGIIVLFTTLFCTGKLHASTNDTYDKREIECLARNVYFESRGEPLKGQLAVIYTTLNRSKSGKFPNDLCKVVYQPAQFSWTRQKNKQIKEKEVYNDIKDTVHEVLRGEHKDVTQGATYFHATSIRRPYWVKGMRCTARIGGHAFYRPSK